MIRYIKFGGMLAMIGFLVMSCNGVTNNQPEEILHKRVQSTAKSINGTDRNGTEELDNKVSQSYECKDAGDTGQTAIFVNESVYDATIDFADHDCDLAIYFDSEAPRGAIVRNTTIIQETGASGTVMGIWNNGGEVTVTNSRFTTSVTGQYLPIRFDAGASGVISDNELSGNHRVGILIRGEGTDVHVMGNTITGTGARTDGWAENGVQMDQGAQATVVNNKIGGHWWDGESNWASTGILLFSSKAKVANNILTDNEFSILVFGEENKVKSNKTSSDVVSQSSLSFKAYGILLAGTGNHLSGNTLVSTDGAVGIYIYDGSGSNRVTGNRIGGFETAVYDGGDDSMIRGTPAPFKN